MISPDVLVTERSQRQVHISPQEQWLQQTRLPGSETGASTRGDDADCMKSRIHDWGIMVGVSHQCWKDRLSAVFPY
jgi:hypothetical protein